MVKCPVGNRQQQAADDKVRLAPKRSAASPASRQPMQQYNGGDAVGLQGNGRRKTIVLLQPDRRHQDHHHHASRQQPGQQHRDHHRLPVLERHRFYRQLLRQRCAAASPRKSASPAASGADTSLSDQIRRPAGRGSASRRRGSCGVRLVLIQAWPPPTPAECQPSGRPSACRRRYQCVFPGHAPATNTQAPGTSPPIAAPCRIRISSNSSGR